MSNYKCQYRIWQGDKVIKETYSDVCFSGLRGLFKEDYVLELFIEENYSAAYSGHCKLAYSEEEMQEYSDILNSIHFPNNFEGKTTFNNDIPGYSFTIYFQAYKNLSGVFICLNYLRYLYEILYTTIPRSVIDLVKNKGINPIDALNISILTAAPRDSELLSTGHTHILAKIYRKTSLEELHNEIAKIDRSSLTSSSVFESFANPTLKWSDILKLYRSEGMDAVLTKCKLK